MGCLQLLGEFGGTEHYSPTPMHTDARGRGRACTHMPMPTHAPGMCMHIHTFFCLAKVQ